MSASGPTPASGSPAHGLLTEPAAELYLRNLEGGRGLSGHVYKRCGCPVHRDAKGKKLPCPRTHGSWTFVANATMEGPLPRRQHTKGGFATKREAEAALRAFQASVDRGEVQPQSKITVKDYVLRWLDAVEPSLAVTAAGNYRILMPGTTSCASTTGPGRPGPPDLALCEGRASN